MNDRTGWDDERQQRSRNDYDRDQQGGWQSEATRQHRQQENWGGQQGGWNDDGRGENRGRGGQGREGYRQPEQREWRSTVQQGTTGATGMGWSAGDSDIGARGRDQWNQRDNWGQPGSQSFAADYGQRGGGADYDRASGRGGFSGANTPGFGRGYGADYTHAQNADNPNDRGFFAKAGDEIASWFGDEDAARRREQDHRGHGPADYTRSDERIREDVNDRLTEDPRVDARKITVKVESGEVTLSGTVTSREAKRRAEDSIDHISGVKHVQNNLRVEQGNTPWQSPGTGSQSALTAASPTSTTGTSGLTGATGTGATPGKQA